MSAKDCMHFSHLALSAIQYDDSLQMDSTILVFPVAQDLVNYTSQISLPLLAKLPLEVITERLRRQNGSMDLHDIVQICWNDACKKK